MVKPFKPSGKANVGDTPTNLQKPEFNLQLTGKQEVIQGAEASPAIMAKAYKVKITRQDTPSNHDAAESYLSSTIESEENTQCDASSNFDSAESSSKLSSKKWLGTNISNWKVESRRGVYNRVSRRRSDLGPGKKRRKYVRKLIE